MSSVNTTDLGSIACLYSRITNILSCLTQMPEDSAERKSVRHDRLPSHQLEGQLAPENCTVLLQVFKPEEK